MSSPESQESNKKSDLEALFARIDQHAHQSDPENYEVEAYFEVVRMGEAALAGLLAAGETMSPWRIRAIINIAEGMQQSIAGLPLSGSTYREYLDVVLNWGVQNGYLPDRPPAEQKL